MKATTHEMKNLSKHLSGNIVKAEAIICNEGGARLWEARDENGEVRFVIEGETGELIGNYEDLEEAIAEWN